MPFRPCGDERHHLRRTAGHPGGHPLSGRTEAKSGELLHDATSCSMCRRLIINAGIEKVVIRRDVDTYDTVNVHDWVENDDTLGSSMAY